MPCIGWCSNRLRRLRSLRLLLEPGARNSPIPWDTGDEVVDCIRRVAFARRDNGRFCTAHQHGTASTLVGIILGGHGRCAARHSSHRRLWPRRLSLIAVHWSALGFLVSISGRVSFIFFYAPDSRRTKLNWNLVYITCPP